MKLRSKGKKGLLVLLVLVLVIIGVSVLTDTPPFVVINGKAYWVFTRDLDLENGSYKDPKSYYSNKDVKALKHMRWVKELNLTYTHITDVSFLNEMCLLRKVFYFGNAYQIEDWTPISNCKKLETFCGFNLGNFYDLSVFKELVNLKSLYIETPYGIGYIRESKVNDISDVKYLVNLEVFAVCGKDITDISALKRCLKLKRLYLYEISAAADYSVLFEIPDLEYLAIPKGVLKEYEIRTLEGKGVSVHEHEQTETE